MQGLLLVGLMSARFDDEKVRDVKERWRQQMPLQSDKQLIDITCGVIRSDGLQSYSIHVHLDESGEVITVEVNYGI